MNRIQNSFSSKSKRGLKRIGWSGFIGVLALLVCELPVVLAIIGLGGLSSVASGVGLAPMFEHFAINISTAIGIAIVGALAIVILTAIRYTGKQKTG